MKFYRSRFFIICVIVAAVLVLIPSALSIFGYADVVRGGLKTVAKPFEWCGKAAADAVSGFVSVFSDHDKLTAENAKLKDELRDTEELEHENAVLAEENAWLRSYLKVKQDFPNLLMTDASIISRESGNYATVLTLDRGQIHGIKKNMPVITADGVFGHVSEVGLDWCKVLSIIETSSAVGVYTDRTGVIGTVEGSLELREQGKCLMSYSANADIRVGDKVYTSGTGTIYPSGLLIGSIVSIEADEVTRQLIAVVEPAVDFNALEELTRVMVICGYNGEG